MALDLRFDFNSEGVVGVERAPKAFCKTSAEGDRTTVGGSVRPTRVVILQVDSYTQYRIKKLIETLWGNGLQGCWRSSKHGPDISGVFVGIANVRDLVVRLSIRHGQPPWRQVPVRD